jgi:hypothetical protein
MKAHGRDRGGISMAVIAPILAAAIGGAAAIGAAVQIVNLAPSQSDPGPPPSSAGSAAEVEYGGR